VQVDADTLDDLAEFVRTDQVGHGAAVQGYALFSPITDHAIQFHQFTRTIANTNANTKTHCGTRTTR
jgi:hypothetical protein